jgi:prolyl 4-hydroxylase
MLHWKYLWIVLIVVAIFVAATIFWYAGDREPKGRGYCDSSAPWTPPEVIQNFISPEERQYILNQAGPLFEESKILSGTDHSIRKSETAWLERDDPVVKRVIERACSRCGLPFENAEKMQVVKYGPSGYYNEHYDASCDDNEESVEFELNGGQRLLTVLIYLNQGFEGGATRFITLERDYRPPMDSALVFYSLQTPNSGNQCHPLSLHAGMPVLSGEKYIANVWIREQAYTP